MSTSYFNYVLPTKKVLRISIQSQRMCNNTEYIMTADSKPI